jgi:hypothetical protein
MTRPARTKVEGIEVEVEVEVGKIEENWKIEDCY